MKLDSPSHAGGFIVRQLKTDCPEVLLIKKDKNQSKYFLPGGRLENNESEIEGAVREIAEETGLTAVDFLADLGLVTRRGIDDRKRPYQKTIRYFLFNYQETGPDGWISAGDPDKCFFCSWQPLSSFPDLTQFREEAHLSAAAQKILG